MANEPRPRTYTAAGVDVAAGNAAVQRLLPHVQRTLRPGVLSEIGRFGGLFGLDLQRYPDPVLVAGADGVGSKLKVALMLGRHDTVGIDLVAMNANDVVVQGAEPLFFLDYIGIGKMDPDLVSAVVAGIAEGCVQAGCALLGGETAELPDFYPVGEYDLAGFCVGVVNRDRILDGRDVQPGDAVIGLPASGLHSNGYSLARKVLLRAQGGVYDLAEQPAELGGRTVGEELLVPTRLYARSLLALREQVEVRAAAHITGGGLTENIPRCLPGGLGVQLRWNSWPVPPIFPLIQRLGEIADAEMEMTFNLGLGMVVVVPAAQREAALTALGESDMAAVHVGEVTDRPGVVVLR